MTKRDKHSGQKERFSHVRKIYDAFPVKDMSFDEFRRAYERETSPVNARRELKELVRYRGQQRTQSLIAAHSKKQINAKLMEN